LAASHVQMATGAAATSRLPPLLLVLNQAMFPDAQFEARARALLLEHSRVGDAVSGANQVVPQNKAALRSLLTDFGACQILFDPSLASGVGLPSAATTQGFDVWIDRVIDLARPCDKNVATLLQHIVPAFCANPMVNVVTGVLQQVVMAKCDSCVSFCLEQYAKLSAQEPNCLDRDRHDVNGAVGIPGASDEKVALEVLDAIQDRHAALSGVILLGFDHRMQVYVNMGCDAVIAKGREDLARALVDRFDELKRYFYTQREVMERVMESRVVDVSEIFGVFGTRAVKHFISSTSVCARRLAGVSAWRMVTSIMVRGPESGTSTR